MLIGELAERAGVSVQTIRFYERNKLLPKPSRRLSGYREYVEADLRRLDFIRKAKALGFALEEIREILTRTGPRGCPCGTVLEMAEQHLATIRQRIKDLQAFEKMLSSAVVDWKRRPTKADASLFCALIEQFVK
jgi:DNA-binding transcriptional MerR regulator